MNEWMNTYRMYVSLSIFIDGTLPDFTNANANVEQKNMCLKKGWNTVGWLVSSMGNTYHCVCFCSVATEESGWMKRRKKHRPLFCQKSKIQHNLNIGDSSTLVSAPHPSELNRTTAFLNFKHFASVMMIDVFLLLPTRLERSRNVPHCQCDRIMEATIR